MMAFRESQFEAVSGDRASVMSPSGISSTVEKIFASLFI
jgi:hypothetical protein